MGQVYDITSATSLIKAKSWIAELQRQADPGIIVCLAGNKSDLEERREVKREEAEAFAKEEGLLFFECSAKSNSGVVEMFNAIGEFPPSPFPCLLFLNRFLGEWIDRVEMILKKKN